VKLTQRCPKCNHNHLLYIPEVADVSEGHQVRPMAVARTETKVSVFGLAGTTSGSVGELEAGVCRRCGYTELYTKEPESIPIDGDHVREIIGPE